MSKEMKVALIGAIATVIAAIIGAVIAGIFLLRSSAPPQPTLVSPDTATMTPTTIRTPIATIANSTSTAVPTSTPTTVPTSGNASVVLQTATATVNGQSETILTDAQGKTLYYFTPDTSTTSACTGGCATVWPPLLMTGSGTPTSATSLPGKLTEVTTANGSQVEYNGHFLYTYTGDTAPGQTTGEGKFGKWFVATPNLTV